MKKLKLIWIEDDEQFGPSIHFKIEDQLEEISIELSEPELLTNGKHVWETVRTFDPDVIMMDHNLEDVTINGANLVVEIRLHDNEIPIIFYSSEMGPELMQIVENEKNVFTVTRQDVSSELVRLIKERFA